MTLPPDKRDQEGFIRNPRTGHWWREPGNGATENKDEAHGYTREQFDVLAAAMPNLEFHPLAPVSFAAGIITAEPITTYAELEAAYQKAILGRHISEIAPVLALRNKALDSFFAPSSIGARELLLDIYQADINGVVTFELRDRILRAVGLEAWSCAQEARHGVRCSCWCGVEGRCTASFKDNERTGLGAATEPSSLADAKAPTAEAVSAPLSAIVPRWIPVSERQPEGREDVLTCSQGRYVATRSAAWVRELWAEAVREKIECAITHWQALPSAPTDDTGHKNG